MSNAIPRWITTAEAAKKIGCTQRHVRHLAQLGRIRKRVLSSRRIEVWVADVKQAARQPYTTGRPRGS